jgi:3-dehydroquinate synthase
MQRETPLPYPVLLAESILESAGEIVAQHAPAHSYAIISDANVARLYGDRVLRSFGAERVQLFEMPAGESAKTVRTWESLSEALLAASFGRDTTIVALGGGVTGDVAGFVAATYMRGVPYVHIPTTVVAMVDSSIGGKTGVNTHAGKNLIGAFHHPSAVIVDPTCLTTLDERELRAGMAEVLKHGIILDAQYFDDVVRVLPSIIASRGASPPMAGIILRSIQLKGGVVASDEREAGLRKILNFGHTIGHAIESLSNYSILHGEAIAIGMCIEARMAEQQGVASAGTTATVCNAMQRADLPTARPPHMSGTAILDAAASDKKARAGTLELALPERIGRMAGAASGWVVRLTRDQMLEALN